MGHHSVYSGLLSDRLLKAFTFLKLSHTRAGADSSVLHSFVQSHSPARHVSSAGRTLCNEVVAPLVKFFFFCVFDDVLIPLPFAETISLGTHVCADIVF